MKILVKEIKAYRFMELDEYNKEKAKINYLEKERLPEFFSEDLTEALKEQGLSHLKTCYSLSNCQSDGLCLHGHITHSEIFGNKFKGIALKNVHHKQVQSVNELLYRIDFEHHSQYYHANTISIESYNDAPTDRQDDIINRIVANVKAWYYSFCREWEEYGYKYFYEISDEEMIYGCELNDCWFTDDGNIIDTDIYRNSIN
ncbi:MAG: hypothetical protein LBP83_01710 [Dysgonamonadaceae bacterium]|jgi:hypothetical protein|nr:hypothetical protein [Dysgonamonadaceae bacterium]